jgi:uncharacterized membrane protein YcaP (DUF421 family)
MDSCLGWIFGGDTPSPSLEWWQMGARAILVYVVGVLVVRMGKSRLVGRVSALDILVGFMLGSLLSRGITGHASLSGTAIASAALIATHWLFTLLAARWHVFGKLTKGNAVQLVQDGHMLPNNMRSSHISEHDLVESLRLHGIDDVAVVAKAFKERNGKISVVKKG